MSTETPVQLGVELRPLRHAVDVDGDRLARAASRSSSQVHERGSSTSPLTVKPHSSSGVCGVGPGREHGKVVGQVLPRRHPARLIARRSPPSPEATRDRCHPSLLPIPLAISAPRPRVSLRLSPTSYPGSECFHIRFGPAAIAGHRAIRNCRQNRLAWALTSWCTHKSNRFTMALRSRSRKSGLTSASKLGASPDISHSFHRASMWPRRHRVNVASGSSDLDDVGREHHARLGAEVERVVRRAGRHQERVAGVEGEGGPPLDHHLARCRRGCIRPPLRDAGASPTRRRRGSRSAPARSRGRGSRSRVLELGALELPGELVDRLICVTHRLCGHEGVSFLSVARDNNGGAVARVPGAPSGVDETEQVGVELILVGDRESRL